MQQAKQSHLRIAALAVSYLILLFGALSILAIPFYASLLIFTVGAVIATLSSRAKVPMTKRSRIVLVTGCVVIVVVLAFLDDAALRQWTPRPAGYIPAWFACFHGIRHVRYLISSHA